MRLHRLSITAFGPFADTQEVDFDTLSAAGIFLLHGATGAGKTSVLDAVCYALYDAVPGARQQRGGAGRDAPLRSDHAPADTYTEVRLELTVGGRRLEITRNPARTRPKRRGTGVTTEKARSHLREYDPAGARWRALSRSHQEIGEEVGQLLGMSREQFCQVVLLPQGDFARFLRADAEARGRLLGRLFDTRRFAAVEERLAELRRGAEQQVREGDQRLLGIAQQMTGAMRTDLEQPLPARAAGDTGLAPAVLEWAAVARSGARERHDIAESALARAESRQARARRILDDARELARLQQRFADTRQRAQTLETSRPRYEEARATLERARKADRVADALALRDDADRAHRTARAARDHARDRLPAGLADSGADHLAALERRTIEERGRVDAALTAERRSAEIDRERADIDRQARADDDLLADAAGWLAGWDTARRSLQERVETAQEAATRAEQLAGQLEPARARLDAAHARDALDNRAEASLRHLNSAREQANDARENWLDLRERRLRGIAAELAAGLVTGEPCAVCGSADHPAPATAGAGQVDQTAEDAASAAVRRAEAAVTEAESHHASVREEFAAARSAAGGATVSDLVALTERLNREHTEAHRLAAGTHEAREALARAEREREDRLAARRSAENRAAARTSRREALDQERTGLEAELVRGRGTADSVAAHAEQLTRRARLLAEAADTVRNVDTTAGRLKEADDRLADAAFRAGFDTPRHAAAALLSAAEQRDLTHRMDAWQAEAAAVADRLAETDAREAAEQPPARPDTALAAREAADSALRAASSALDGSRAECAQLTALSRRAEEEVRRLGPLRTEYERVARLAGLTAGTSTDNDRKMRLESYVLAARLEQVAAAATARLLRMSSGRYTLVHSDARSGGGKRSGLGLHVVDSWTGSARDTATLSGGETFFVSLALALGLADVVTDEAGGARLDTLFIDEGFGSLDDQTLDEVLDVLDSLRERDRSVGIVSHVADLRRRIPTQLEVTKTRRGSTLGIRTGGPDG
ncbi:SMC family ATPase [Streptomyces sp. NBC_01498]|uniref:SMC family ATPase n=1 Tax=Streptomyces sp. NBC_01498 TaxID=2975870 RepID=UPI002E7B4EA8|nr:SMC family ATPase [Streptomyces sp. NBC_01498]WTL28074.1 SMC family ATPase [Streptomyces sp. NBC_01498]